MATWRQPDWDSIRRDPQRFWEPKKRLSILELTDSGTLELEIAAILWLLVERRTSLITAAGPRLAGKTTLLNALLDLRRPEVDIVHIKGEEEDFRFLEDTEPARTYLIAAEISNHLPAYTWGDVARRVFEVLPKGYALGATVHADAAEEVLGMLHGEIGVPVELLAHVGMIITIEMGPPLNGAAEPMRRISSVSLIRGRGQRLAIDRVDCRRPVRSKELARLVAARLGTTTDHVLEEMRKRARSLERLGENGRTSSAEVRRAVVDFYTPRGA